VKGIEPSCPAWEAGVLPLNYTRKRELPILDVRLPVGNLRNYQNKHRPTPDIFHRHFPPVLRVFRNILQMRPRDTLVV
jgi:hypothetical protein